MVAMASRTGRELQRYNQGCRQVVGCIPYRIGTDSQSSTMNGTLTEEIEVLLISSQKSPKLMFPKGGWEIDESMEEAALRETIEEAGVDGIVGSTLGKWSFMSRSLGKLHDGHMFPMLVTEELEVWPEQNVRQRVWMSVKEAREVCVHWWMTEALDVLISRLTELQRKIEGSQVSCSMELFVYEERLRGVVDQSGEEDADLCLVRQR